MPLGSSHTTIKGQFYSLGEAYTTASTAAPPPLPSACTQKDMRRERVLILGAAGRDFHNFQTIYRTKPDQYDVVGFTATQIPRIFGRRFPPELSGPEYPAGLPIWSEDELERLIKEERVDRCLLSYSDLSHHEARDLPVQGTLPGEQSID